MKKEDKLSYGEAMEQLGSILERLNNEELDIDSLSSEVKRATGLIALCRSRLTAAKEQVEELFDKEESL